MKVILPCAASYVSERIFVSTAAGLKKSFSAAKSLATFESGKATAYTRSLAMVSEPRRLWRRYLYHNPRFVLHFGAQLARERRPPTR